MYVHLKFASCMLIQLFLFNVFLSSNQCPN